MPLYRAIHPSTLPFLRFFFPLLRSFSSFSSFSPLLIGNPGLIDYYTPFLQTVHDTCQGKIDIFGGKFYPRTRYSNVKGHGDG